MSYLQNKGQNIVLCKETGKKWMVQSNIYNIYNFNLLQLVFHNFLRGYLNSFGLNLNYSDL